MKGIFHQWGAVCDLALPLGWKKARRLPPRGLSATIATLLASGLLPLPLRASVELVPLTNTWRFEQTTNLDGVTWWSPGYDDSNWPTGKALLYVESNVLVSPRNTSLTIGRTTYYFRSHFQVPFPLTNAFVAFSSRIDDGAVFYINGREVQRVRLPSAPAAVSYATLASGTPSGGDAISTEVFTLPEGSLTNFVSGDNVLAVEVHQNVTTSDDVVFGTAVTWRFTNAAPVVITQPAAVSVLDGRPAALVAIVDGDPTPTLQWFKGNAPISGATNSTLGFSAAYLTNDGSYSLTASNTFGTVTTSNALLSVLADTNTPAIVSTLAQKNLTNIVVSFSEPVRAASAAGTNNYAIFQTALPSNRLDVLGVSLSGNSAVVLQTTPRIPGLNYSLRVNGIQDISSVSNAIAPDSTLALNYQVDLIAVDAATTWRYFQQGLLPATNWMATNYDDSNWPQGAAVFAGGSPAHSTTDPIRTTLALTAGSNAVVTYYFRTLFDLPGPLSVGTLRLREIADDGAIFHLNGSEVFSVGMPATRPVDYQTYASRTVGTAAYEPALNLPGWSLSESNLVTLRNCIAIEVHQSTNSLADTAFAANLEAVIMLYHPRVQLSAPAVVQEGAGTLTNQAWVSILEPLETNLVLQLTSTRPADVSVSAQIVVLAGNTNSSFNLIVSDDLLLNGPRAVTLTAEIPGLAAATANLLLLDNETNTIQLVIAPTITETNGWLSGEIHFGQPAGADIVVTLASSDLTELIVPASVIVPAGATSTVFQVTVLDDLLLDGPQTITLSASVAGWPTGFAGLVVEDNEPRTITVTLPATVLEGAGTLVSAGRVQLAGVAVSNLTVALSSSLPELVSVASNATVNAGQSNAVFDLKLVDNTLYEPPRVVVIIAAISGFTTGSNTVTVLDDDADHFGFSMIGSPQDTATPFNVTVTAQHPNGSVVTNFKYSVGITANALEGNLPVEPATIGPFISGQWSGTVRVTAPSRLVRLSCPLAPGESNPFHVGPPPFRILAQPAADIAFHTASGALFASVPATGGIYSNQLIVINPFAATVTNSYPLGDDPGQIELSPNGQFLYTTVSNRLALRRFDLTTRQAGLQFGVGSFFDVPNGVTDFTVLAGASDSVCASTYTTFGGNYGGVWRFNGGSPVNLDTFSAAAPYWIESSSSSQTLYGYQNNNQYPLMRGLAQPGSALVVSNGVIGGGQITYRSGVLYNNAGRAVVADTFVVLGDYPNVIENIRASASVDVDPVLKRTFFLSGYVNYGASFYKLKAYDRDSFVPLGQLPIPASLMKGGAGRLLRWSTNGLVFNTGSQIWFVQSGLLQPTYPAADLLLTQSAVPLPAVLGTNVAFMLTLSNAGPGLATFIRVSNALPANAIMVGSTPTVGTVTQSTNTVIWNLTQLEAGSNATLLVSLRFGSASWQTNTATAVAYEADPDFTNNISRLGLYVQLPAEREGAFALQYSAEDMVYDPVRDRLLLSVGTGIGSQNNGIAVLNPYQGTVDSFASLGKHPTRLARSDDGRQLYVSLPDDARVRRLTLTNFQQNLEFSLGGTYTYNSDYLPFFAADLAAVPGAPNSLVVWRRSQALYGSSSGGHGIAVYDNGIARSNTAFAGGTFSLEFDTDAGTLYAFNAASDFWSKQGLYRCELTTNGVTNSPALFPEGLLAGQYSRYALGRMFSTQGRVAQLHPPMMEWAFPGGESTTLVKPDAASGRVYYLVQDNGWRIKAYDIESYRALGNIAVTNVVGTPTSLIRWGTNGLAFRTTGGQVFIVRTPLVQPSAAADIAVEIDGPDAPVATGSEALFTLSLTNRGPASAEDVVLMNSFSPAVEIVWTFCTEGSCLTTNGQVVWRLPRLDSGQDSFAAVAVRSMQTGAVSVAANVISAMPDPRVGDNAAMRVLQVGAPLDLDRVTRLQISANDLAWSTSLGRLLITATTNMPNWSGSLLSVDPLTLAVQFESTLGNDAGRLAISRDGGMLYAGVDYGVNALTLPDLAIVNRFLINPTDPRGFAYDLEAVPGANQSVVVGSRGRIGLYDSGIQRTNTGSFSTTGLSLEFGDEPSLLYCQDYAGGGFRRYTINAQGISLLDSDTLLPAYTAMDLVWNAGRIYSSVGKVINPLTRTVVGTIAGIPTGSRVCYDETSARVFYLCPGVNQAELRAYDGPTLLPAGNRVIPGVSGALGSFVHWGLDGFAFTTSSGQLMLFRSSLVVTNPPADISVSLALSDPPNLSGSNLTATIVITNAGPNPATQVVWTNTLPAGALVASASSTAGDLATVSNIISGQLPVIAAGATATISVTYKVTSVGVFTNQVFAFSSAVDPAFANNNATRLLWIQSPTGFPPVMTLSLPLKDLERDPVRPLLYASFGSTAGPLADSVVAIDPANGDIGTPVRVGSDPGRLAVSPDGQFLYAGLDGAGRVQKLALPALTPVSSFAVPQNQQVLKMVVSPSNSDMVALRRTPGGITSLHVAGLQRPGELADQDLFAFSGTSGELFGCDGFHSGVKLYRLNTDSNGLMLLEGQSGKQSQATDLKSSGALLFYNLGMAVSSDTKRVQAVMPVSFDSLVEPDVNAGRVFYLTPQGKSWTLRAFDLTQAVEVASVPVTGVSGTPRRLLRWGSDGFAISTSSGQLILLHGQLVPGSAPADLVLSQSASAAFVPTNDTVTFTITLTNRGPGEASGIVVTQALSLAVSNVVVSSVTGNASFTNNGVTWLPGSLSVGAVATLDVSLRPAQTGTLAVSATARQSVNDPSWANNAALTVVSITNQSSAAVLQLPLPTRELIYDPVRNLIYATLPASYSPAGNTVASINPTTGSIEQARFAGSEANQMALSDDARFLYVSLNGTMGVQRLNLQTGAADLEYELGEDDMYNAFDVKVSPGHPETIAVSRVSLNTSGDYPRDVSVYDSGVRRTQTGRPSKAIDFSSGGDLLFGYVTPGTGYGFLRMPLNANGVITNEVFTSFTSDLGDLQFSNGRLWAAAGTVLEPNVPVVLGTVSATGLLAVDEAAGRVFYLAQNGSSWELRAFNAGTFQSIGTQVVANVQGTPGSLIRCGNDRLAFRTSANQLFIVQSALASPTPLPAADLAVSQAAAQDFSAPTETLRFTITVTNRGGGNVSNALLVIQPPNPIASLSLQTSQGTNTNTDGNFICNLGALVAGQTATATLNVTITNSLTFSNYVSISAEVPDRVASNNVSTVGVAGLFFQRTDSVRGFPLATRNLAYDAMRRRVLASVSGTNQIAWFDPETATADGMMEVGGQPDQLAVSGDSQFLYVSFVNTSLVQRVHMPSRMVDLTYMLPTPYAPRAFVVLPGQPHALVLTYATTSNSVTTIFDGAVQRTNQVLEHGYKLLAPSSDGGFVYGYDNGSTGGNSPDVFRMAVSSNGLASVDNGPSDTPWGNNEDMTFSGGWLYFGNGNVLNPSNWVEETAFNVGWGRSVTIDASAARIAHLVGDPYSATQLIISLLTTRTQLTVVDLGYLYQDVGSLVQCGADRHAFRSERSIFFVRSSVIPSADIVVRASLATNQVMVGETVSLQVIVSNAGPYSTTGVLLTNILPQGFNLVSATLSQGTVSTNGWNVVAAFGALGTNGGAVLNLVLSPTAQALGVAINTAEVGSSSLPDPIVFNNRVALSLFVLPADTDHDGMPDNWELAYGLNPTNALDATFDSDCDGLANLQEYLAGRNPLLFENMRLASPRLSAPGQLEATLVGAPGKVYTLEASTNLVDWQSVATVMCQTENQRIQVPISPMIRASFFRLRTDTKSAHPVLTLLSGPLPLNSPPLIRVAAPPGRLYSLQASTNLVHWTTISNYFGMNCTTVITDPTTDTSSTRFYRILLP